MGAQVEKDEVNRSPRVSWLCLPDGKKLVQGVKFAAERRNERWRVLGVGYGCICKGFLPRAVFYGIEEGRGNGVSWLFGIFSMEKRMEKRQSKIFGRRLVLRE